MRDWFVGAPPREGGELQRSPGARFGVRDARVATALAVMEADLEAPPSRAELASASGVGIRQLERLFARELGVSIGAHRRRVKLEQADALLRQTTRPVLDIALACGFASASQFARAFGRWKGVTPSAKATHESTRMILCGLQTLNRGRVDQFRCRRDEPLPMLRRVRALPLLAQVPNPA